MNDQHKPSEEVNEFKMESDKSKWKGKKWLVPGTFVLAIATLFTIMWNYQESQPTSSMSGIEVDNGQTNGTDTTITDGETDAAAEVILQWPVVDRKTVTISGNFYDENGSEDERLTGIIQTGNTFMTRNGINFSGKNNASFDVTAAESGQVIVVEQHPLNGQVVEIQHDNGLITVYQSLSDVKVKQGDEVKKGAVIAKSGVNELEKEAGNHLYFAVMQNGEAINPQPLLE